jgi:predicted anti-sigma-YlaC factor YlaD
MTQECSDVERIVWSDGPEAAPQEHLAECGTCREQSRQAGDLRAALSGLKTRIAVAPADLEPAIFAAVSRTRLDWARDVVSHPRFWRGAAVGAAAAATAAVGLIVARRRLSPRVEDELVAEAS